MGAALSRCRSLDAHAQVGLLLTGLATANAVNGCITIWHVLQRALVNRC